MTLTEAGRTRGASWTPAAGAIGLAILSAVSTVALGRSATAAMAVSTVIFCGCLIWFDQALLVLVVVVSVVPAWLFVEVSPKLPLITPGRVLTFIILSVAVVRVWRGDLTLPRWGLWPAATVWIAANVVSIPSSLDPVTSVMRTLSEAVELILLGYVVFAVFPGLRARRVFEALSWATLVNSGLGLAALVGLDLTGYAAAADARFTRSTNALVSTSGVRLGVERIQGTFQHPSFLATFLVLTIPICYALLLTSKGRGRFLHAAALTLAAPALLLTGTRAAWLLGSVGVVAVAIAARSSRRQVLQQAGATTIAIGFVLLLFPRLIAPIAALLADLVSPAVTATTTTTSYRLELARAVFASAAQRPWFGYGPGTFDQIGISSVQAGLLTPLTSPDNHFLRVLAETGLVGLAAFVLLLGSAGTLGVRAVRLVSAEPTRLLALSALVALTAFVAMNLTISALSIVQDAAPAWIVFGALTGLARPPVSPKPSRAGLSPGSGQEASRTKA